jgi:hypothetical protein
MKHFESQDWIDFVRRISSQEQNGKMQAHLDSACPSCLDDFGIWKWMTEFGQREASAEPPEAVLRIVKSAIMSRAPEKERSLMRELAELVFDSYSQPQVSGVRSTASAPRQLLYRAGSLLIDMRLQSTSDTERFALIGQVLVSGEAKHAVRQVPVHLLSGTDQLASTATNQFGEFYLEHRTSKDLQVSLEVSEERNVFIPLDESIWRMAFGH